MITIPITTTGTAGSITIDLETIWWAEWWSMWADIGRLAHMHANEDHIPRELHKLFMGPTDLGHCHCFNCRVVTAWGKRHDPIPTPRKRKARR